MKLKRTSDLPGWVKVTNHGAGRGVFVQEGLDTSKPLFRYMTAKDFRSTLCTSELYMSNVKLWTDPYEKWWCKHLFRQGSKLNGVNAYGLCCTRRTRDEPFWRLYQDRCNHKDQQGCSLPVAAPPVRLRANTAKLISLLSAEVDRVEAKAFIGSVGYCKEADVKAKAAALRESSKEVAKDAATALHLKRLAFWFEREIRVLWIDRQGARDANTIRFDPLELIERVMIGPTLDIAAGKQLRSDIVAMGIPAERIKRSLIYSQPK